MSYVVIVMVSTYTYMKQANLISLIYLNSKQSVAVKWTLYFLISADRYCDNPTTVNGYKIKKHSTIMVPIYSIHHDPDVWEDPEEFRPERSVFEKLGSEVLLQCSSLCMTVL